MAELRNKNGFDRDQKHEWFWQSSETRMVLTEIRNKNGFDRAQKQEWF